MRTLDLAALAYPVDPRLVSAFRERSRANPAYASQFGTGRYLALGCALVMLGLIVLGFALVTGFLLFGWMLADPGNPAPFIIGTVGITITAGLVVLAVVSTRRSRTSAWEKYLRLETFAAANDLVFSPASPKPHYPGLIFGQGGDQKTVDHLRSREGRFLDIGNFQFTVSNGKTTSTHQRGFMALHLDRRLPHMVLDATANGSLGLAAFGRDQVLSLEGDFNRFFTLYCPRQYERDAYYVFTPDLMALLIDMASPFDVEIIDNWMFVYTNGPFPMTNPGLHERLFRIVDTVGAKTLRQTSRYVDERIGVFEPNVVAPPGQRLRRRLPVGAIIAIVIGGVALVAPGVGFVVFLLVGLATTR